MRQAYLIIAHNKIEQLKFLISLLDYEKHDIFILFDKKGNVKDKHKEEILKTVKYSKVIYTKEIPIYWGDYSLVEAEMQLLSTAKNHQEYSMYHLLSGADLPLDTAENIYDFFDKRKEYNFLTMVSDELFNRNRVYERVAYKTLFSNFSSRSISNRLLKKGLNIYRKLEIGIQRKLKVDFFKKFDLELKYASNWCSLNNWSVGKIIESSSLIEDVFKSGKVQDELFVPTILHKHNLLGSVYSIEPTNDKKTDFQGNLRYINWWDGSPHTWTDSKKDIEQLKYGKEQGHLFSRKFDLEKYPEMKERILELIYEDKFK